MTRLKKIFASMLLVFVTCCSFLGNTISNIARSIFTFGNANASTTTTVDGNKNKANTEVVSGDVISIPGFNRNVKKGESVTLPVSEVKYTPESSLTTTPEAVDAKNVYVKITDLYGQVISEYDSETGTTSSDSQISIDETTKDITFTPSKVGNYTVQYFVKSSNDVWSHSSEMSIEVTADSYSLTFGTNSYNVMPTTVKYGENQSVKVNLPLLYDASGNLIENENILLGAQYGTGENENPYYYVLRFENIASENSVSLSDATGFNDTTNVYTEYKTYTVKKVDGSIDYSTFNYALYVDFENSNNQKYTNYNENGEVSALTLNNVSTTASAYEKTPYTISNITGGINLVNYKLYTVKNGVRSSQPQAATSYTITGSSNFDQDGIKLVASTSSTITTSTTSYGEKTYLPSVSAVDSNDNNTSSNVFYYYTITVADNGEQKSTDDYVTMGRDENGFYFVPKAELGSTYTFNYNVVDAFGNTVDATSATLNYEVSITDRNAPINKYTKAYNVSDVDQSNPESIKDFEDYSYVIPSSYMISSQTTTRTIHIPALATADYSGIKTAERRISSTAFLDENGETSSSTQYLYITTNSGLPEAPSCLDEDISLRSFVMFKDYQGRYIDAEGYFVDEDLNYVDEDGNSVEDSEKVFAFKDEDGNNLTGTALRDALNACEAIVTLRSDVFSEGSYDVYMRSLQDTTTTRSSYKTFTVELSKEDGFTTSTPTVEFKTTNISSVVEGQDINVSVPTVSDNIDKNLLVKYYVDVEGAKTAEGKDTLIEVSLSDDGKYVSFNTNKTDGKNNSIFDLAAQSTTKSFKVVAFAINDFALGEEELLSATSTSTLAEAFKKYDAESDTFAHIGYDYFTTTVKDYSPENDTAPVVSKLNYTTQTLTQFEEVEVEGITFTDDTNLAHVRFSVTDTNGNSYSAQSLGTTTITGDATSGYTYTFPGIKFIPSNADAENYYTVTYTIEDAANNVITHSFVLVHAIDKEAPTISGLGNSATIELGEVYSFSKLKATDNSGDDLSYSATVTKNGVNYSHLFNTSTLTFSPEEAGTYTIKISAKDSNNNTSSESTFTLTVQDTMSPVLYVDGIEVTSSNATENKLFSENSINTSTSPITYPSVSIPTFTAVDQKAPNEVAGLVNRTTTATLTITAPKTDSNSVKEYSFDMAGNILNNVANTLNLSLNGNEFEFTPTSRGQYVVTYSATDASGNSAVSKVINVYVGDTEKPELLLTDTFASTLSNGFIIGENTQLKVSKKAVVYTNDSVNYDSKSTFYVKDNYGFDSTHDENLDADVVTVTTTITNSNGSTVSATSSDDNSYTYDFTTAGTYTATFKVYDEVGNYTTVTKTFYVTTKQATSTDTTTIVGTLLIVLSALILVGVIIYFVKGTKSLSKNKKKSQKQISQEKSTKEEE